MQKKSHTNICLTVHLVNELYIKKNQQTKNNSGKGKRAWSEINIWKNVIFPYPLKS